MAYNTGTTPTLAELITAKFIPERFSLEVLNHTQSNLVVVNRTNQNFREQLNMGYKVSIPVMSEIAATEVTPGTEPTVRNAAGTAVSITVDKWFESTIEISDMEDIQDPVDYLSKAAISTSYAVAKKIDTDVGALFSTLGGATQANSDGDTLTDKTILDLMEYLDLGDVPDNGERSLIVNPSSKVDMLGIDKFVRNDYVRNPVIATGQFGQIYNMFVFITNNLSAASVGKYGVMMHRDAIGVVIQNQIRSRLIPKPWEFVTKLITDAIWGEDELRNTFGRSFYTRTQ